MVRPAGTPLGGGTRSGREGGGSGGQAAAADLFTDGLELGGWAAPLPIIDGADRYVSFNGGDTSEQHRVGKIVLQGG